jgi:hypothetical protein
MGDGIMALFYASTDPAEDAEGYYREALALAVELGMRPFVAHCHLGLGKLYPRQARRGPREPHDRDDDVPGDGHALLAGAGGDGDEGVGMSIATLIAILGLNPRKTRATGGAPTLISRTRCLTSY